MLFSHVTIETVKKKKSNSKKISHMATPITQILKIIDIMIFNKKDKQEMATSTQCKVVKLFNSNTTTTFAR